MNSNKKSINIGILTSPISESGIKPLSNLIDVLIPSSNDIYLITGNVGSTFFERSEIYENVHAHGIDHGPSSNMIVRIAKYAYLQLKMSYLLIKLSRKLDVWIFTVGGDCLILPALAAKILGKKVILVITGSSWQTHSSKGDKLSKAMKILSYVLYGMFDEIIVYSQNIIEEYNLKKYKNKIIIAHKHFIDFEIFNIRKPIAERNNLIGYIGRFSEEKGTLNFVRAIPGVLKVQPDVSFLIGGDGKLRDQIQEYLINNNIEDKVKLLGWIPHDELPEFLNELKLMVLPSYTEGLPNIMLEGMACGTSVLATSVGSIPDFIKDEDTGFIMGSNSPDHIANNISRALYHDDLKNIVCNAEKLVRNDFGYESVVKKYREIFRQI